MGGETAQDKQVQLRYAGGAGGDAGWFNLDSLIVQQLRNTIFESERSW